MSAIQQQIQRDLDATVCALKDLKFIAHELGEASTKLAKQLDHLDTDLRVITTNGLLARNPRLTSELQKISDRIERLRELRNMSEFGAFEVQVNRAVESAWEALP